MTHRPGPTRPLTTVVAALAACLLAPSAVAHAAPRADADLAGQAPPPYGTVETRVRTWVNGAALPLLDADLVLTSVADGEVFWGWVGGDGTAVAEEVPAGEYKVCVEKEEPLDVWSYYTECVGGDPADRYLGSKEDAAFTPVVVTAGGTTVLPVFTLVPVVTVSGSVTGDGIDPWGELSVSVTAHDRTGAEVGRPDVEGGSFSIAGVPAGEYTLRFTVSGEGSEAYSEQWLGGAHSFAGAEFFDLPAGQLRSLDYHITRDAPQVRSRIALNASQGAVQEYGSEARVRLTIPVRHLDGSPARGAVELFAGESKVATLPVVNGTAAYRLPRTHAVGVTTFRARYVPDGSGVAGAASADVAVTVTKAAVALTARALPAVGGSRPSVVVEARTAVAWPQGTVQIRRGAQVVAQGKVQGAQRGVVTVSLPAGTDLQGLTAHYLGSSVVKRGSVPVQVPVPVS